jgi:hypothetical protein
MFAEVAGMIGLHHHAHLFSIDMVACKLFFFFARADLETMIFTISASSVAWDDRYVSPSPAFG